MGSSIPTISAETRTLSEFMAGALGRALPEPVVEAAKHHILDTLAAIVSGSRLHPGRLGIAYVSGLGGVKEAGVVGSKLVTTAAVAAMANGMSAHSDETDDSHFLSRTHPGSAIVPAALAVAERNHAGGRDFLRAVVLGYDVGSRLVYALDMKGFSKLARSCHSYGGTFGAGAAAGALYRLDAERVRHLLSYCAQLASGCGAYMHDRGHVEKAFVYSGKSAQNGIMAATMVAGGFTAADDVFNGERNFLDAYAATPNRAKLIEALGERFEIVQTNIKKWCVGSPIQAALDSLECLMSEYRLTARQVDTIDIHLPTSHSRTVDNRPMPNVNIQHLLALMLTDGSISFASSHDAERMTDPVVAALRGRIRIVPSEELEHAKPPRQAIVEVVTVDGRKLSHRTVAVRGTADNPMSREEVVAKARDLIAPVLGLRKCNRLIRQVIAIEEVSDMASLRPLLAAALPDDGAYPASVSSDRYKTAS